MAESPAGLPGPDTTLDDLLRRGAARHPRRIALRASYGDITYAELDAMADACARALRGLLGGTGGVIAVAAPLHPDFVVAFQGALRSGHTVAPINPALSDEELAHLLGASKARMVFVTDDMVAAVRRARPSLADIVEATLVGPGAVTDANDIRTLDDLIAAYEVRGDRVASRSPAPDDIACVLFTSGTTGPPKGALLTHRNLVVNAAQVAGAHEVDEGSVVLNHLPKYHLMHMNSALHAGATQVLCASKDPVEAVRLAGQSGATHYYSIPMRLHLLAADPRLARTAVPTLRAVASGGSALGAEASRTLADHLGVPVFQGYGLAESSPLTHSATPRDPAPGTVGRVVAATECRIVSTDSGQVLGPDELGEIQVRGPQVMGVTSTPRTPPVSTPMAGCPPAISGGSTKRAGSSSSTGSSTSSSATTSSCHPRRWKTSYAVTRTSSTAWWSTCPTRCAARWPPPSSWHRAGADPPQTLRTPSPRL